MDKFTKNDNEKNTNMLKSKFEHCQEVSEKNRFKISRAKPKSLEFSFKNKVRKMEVIVIFKNQLY